MLKRNGSACACIDLHTHILPAVDDGAVNMEESLRMAQVASADGIRTLVATPHNLEWPATDQRHYVEREVERLNAAIEEAGIELSILPGVEIFIDPQLPEHVEAGRAFPLPGGRYLLLELPAASFPLYTGQVIFHLQVMGFGIILAHPERNSYLVQRPDALLTLVQRGVLLQITAGSLLGQFGLNAQLFGEELMRSGMAHILASDAHGDGRLPVLSEAVEAASTIVGAEEAIAMVSCTPQAILAGRPVKVAQPAPTWTKRRRK